MASKDDVKQDQLSESLKQTTLSPTPSIRSSSTDTQLPNNDKKDSSSHETHKDSSSSSSLSNGSHHHDDSHTKDQTSITFATSADTSSDSKDSFSQTQGLVR
ncbi:hypothetical protein BGZ76_001807, partial [Entomortierella beljakovae]